MSTTLSNLQINLSILGLLAAGDDAAPGVFSVNVGGTAAPTIGTASGNSDKLYTATLSVVSGTPVVLDTTSLTDAGGGAVNLARVQGIWVYNKSTTTGQILTLAGGASNPLFSDSYTIQPNGGVSGCYNPVPGFVTSGTVKAVSISAAAGTVAFRIAILGCSV